MHTVEDLPGLSHPIITPQEKQKQQKKGAKKDEAVDENKTTEDSGKEQTADAASKETDKLEDGQSKEGTPDIAEGEEKTGIYIACWEANYCNCQFPVLRKSTLSVFV